MHLVRSSFEYVPVAQKINTSIHYTVRLFCTVIGKKKRLLVSLNSCMFISTLPISTGLYTLRLERLEIKFVGNICTLWLTLALSPYVELWTYVIWQAINRIYSITLAHDRSNKCALCREPVGFNSWESAVVGGCVSQPSWQDVTHRYWPDKDPL